MADIVSDEDYTMVNATESVEVPQAPYTTQDLFNTVVENNLDKLKLLVETHNLDVNFNDHAALKTAVSYGHFDIVKYLVEAGADASASDSFTLLVCAKNDRSDILEYLIEHGAKVQGKAAKLLAVAIKNNHLDIVKCLIRFSNNNEDNEALRESSEIGRLEIVKFLVEHEVDIHTCNDYPVRWASENGHLEVVKYLVEAGADIHAKSEDALKSAARKGHLAVVKYLVEVGADIYSADCNGSNALALAKNYNHHEIVSYLTTYQKQQANIKKELELANEDTVIRMNKLEKKVVENSADTIAQFFELRKKLEEHDKLFAKLSKFIDAEFQSQYVWINGCCINLDAVDNFGVIDTHSGCALEIVSNGYREELNYEADEDAAQRDKEKLYAMLVTREKYRMSVHLSKQH